MVPRCGSRGPPERVPDRRRRRRLSALLEPARARLAPMGDGDTARLYHELTSYSPDREWTTPVDDPLVLQDFVQNDYDTLPPPCKAYPDGLPAIELPRDWPQLAAPATAVLAGADRAAPARLDPPALARLLHLSAGVVRTTEKRGRR